MLRSITCAAKTIGIRPASTFDKLRSDADCPLGYRAFAADAPMADELLGDIQPGTTLLADKAYDTDAIRNFANPRNCWANIPAKANPKQTFSFSRWASRQRIS